MAYQQGAQGPNYTGLQQNAPGVGQPTTGQGLAGRAVNAVERATGTGPYNPNNQNQGLTGQSTDSNYTGTGQPTAGQGLAGRAVNAVERATGTGPYNSNNQTQGLTGQVGQPMSFTKVVSTEASSQQVCFNIPSTVEVPSQFVETVIIPQPGALRKDGVSSAVEEEARRLRETGLSEELNAAADTFREAERARANAAFIQAEADAVSKASLASLTALEKQRMATEQAHTLLAKAQLEKDALLEKSRLEAEASIESAAQLKLMREREAMRRTEELLASGTGTPGVRYEVREVPLRPGETFEGLENRAVLPADASAIGSTLYQAAQDQPPTGRLATERQMQYQGTGPLGQGGVEQITGHGPVSRIAEGAAAGGTVGALAHSDSSSSDEGRGLGRSTGYGTAGVPATGAGIATPASGVRNANLNNTGDYNPSTGTGGNMGVMSGHNTATDYPSTYDTNNDGVPDASGKKPGFIAKVKNFVERKL